MSPTLSLIAAMARNRVIGIDNRLPWHLPEDLKHFKALTLGHPIVMGRKTFESIGRPLPGRTSIVISRNPQWQADGCLVAGSIAQGLALAPAADEVFVIGGAELYGQALGLAQRLYLTEIDADFAGDAYFPPIDMAQWQEAERVVHEDDGRGFGYAFVRYDRRGA